MEDAHFVNRKLPACQGLANIQIGSLAPAFINGRLLKLLSILNSDLTYTLHKVVTKCRDISVNVVTYIWSSYNKTN